MVTQTLSGTWQLRPVGTHEWESAQVPGCVHTDLIAAGRIPDPFAGENEKQVSWVADQDWEYRREFEAGPELLAQEHVDLVCDGLDTLAELSLNGRQLARTDNMFRQYRWSVKPLLLPGYNTLTVIFRSPTQYIAARQKARAIPSLMNPGMMHLRKVPSHFGWDWGPRLPTSGVWRDIRVEGSSTARLDDVTVRQEHDAGSVTLSVVAALQCWGEGDLVLEATLTAPDGTTLSSGTPVLDGRAEARLLVAQPQLWWPNGLGQQPLYYLEVDLLRGEQRLDQRSYRVGLRTVALQHAPDERGEGFTFVVNGVPVFARGANWIPADVFPARVTPARMEHLIRSAASANMNMLRAWGGGYYEDDRFYDLCDRYGILVWQDFIFANALYPFNDPGFMESVHQEVVDNVRRLRHHTSLALWCGNNEVESLWRVFGIMDRAGTKGLRAVHQDFFYNQLPGWLQAEDPGRAYWAGSPTAGEFLKPTGDACGDMHVWQVWHGLKPFSAYRQSRTRFVSEFGMQSLPALETIAKFAEPKDYRLRSDVLQGHQRSAGGNDKLIYYLTNRLRVPRDFADLVYLTQVMQAEAVRIGVEHWRRDRPRCSGTLYWQLNDCWPAISWAGIDGAGRWKALHYAARRFNAPVALSIDDAGTRAGLHVVNDTPVPWQGQVRWTLEMLTGKVISSGEEIASVGPHCSVYVRRLEFGAQVSTHGRKNLVFVTELWQGRNRLARQVMLFAPEKEIVWPAPCLSAEVYGGGDGLGVAITVKAQALARFVRLSLDGTDVVFSDNYFDLPAGGEATVTCPLPQGWTAEQAKQALRMRSLADVRPAGRPFRDRLRRYRALLNPTSLGDWAAARVLQRH
jgi:beta-mannosidase